MVKIIHPGVIQFEDVCPKCLCKFSFDPEDVTLETLLDNTGTPAAGFFRIDCPYCGDQMTIIGNNERKLKYFTEGMKKVTS